jgi:fluoroquinolone resistance protein
MVTMSAEAPAYHSLTAQELAEIAGASRVYAGVAFDQAASCDNFDFTGCTFDKCLFGIEVLRAADFSQAHFKDCRFAPSRFTSCKFVEAKFHNCALFDAGQRKGSTFAFCDMHAMEARETNFSSCTFERCDLYDVNAVECSFRGVRFNQSTFSKALSRKAVVTRGRFDKCSFAFADLSGLNLQRCEFLSCKFPEAAFFDTDLSDATMLACGLDRAEWDRAKLTGADLRGSTLGGLNLALVADYAGLTVSESEQTSILKELRINVSSE